MLISGAVYIFDMFRGTVKPNRVTWLLWGTIPMITFVAQRFQGVWEMSWFTFAGALSPFVIFGLSFFIKSAYWETTRRDYACLAIAVVGIILWRITSNPDLAIAFSILANLSASYPTIVKAISRPDTESGRSFLLTVIGALISVLSIQYWSFANSAYAVYLLGRNIVLASASMRVSRPTDG